MQTDPFRHSIGYFHRWPIGALVAASMASPIGSETQRAALRAIMRKEKDARELDRVREVCRWTDDGGRSE
jgi:hypothetical protein